MERHLATVWESVADAVGDEVAVVHGATRRTWTDFDDRAARLARAFAEAGLGPGSKVGLYLRNGPEYLEAWYAALKLRAVPVNVNYRYLDDELVHLLTDSGAEALVFHAELGDRVARALSRTPAVRLALEVDDGAPQQVPGAVRYEAAVAAAEPLARTTRSPDDVTMVYTGGTTGLPKGVVSRIGGVVDAVLGSAPPILGEAPVTDPADVAGWARRFVDDERGLVGLPACPLMHATGLSIGAVPVLTFGGRVVLLTAAGLDADELWDAVERERVLTLTLVGDPFARPLLRALDTGRARDLTSLALILSAGAMFSTEVKQGLLDHLPGALVIDFIAATEGSMGMSLASKDLPAVTGRFTPAPGVRVFTAEDREVAPGSEEPGQVAIPGAIPDGYHGDPAKTDRTFRTVDGVRYSFPGDWATVDADGSLRLLGRGSQCINTGGEKVYPEEVEEAVKRHHGIDDCLVFGVDDERLGQRVVAVASATTDVDVDPDQVVAALRAELSAYKLPRPLALVPVVPRAPNGKADYPTARSMFDSLTDDEGVTETR